MIDLAEWAKKMASGGADELRLQTGQPLSVLAEGAVRPISDEPLDTPAMVAALGSVGLTNLIPEGNSAGTPTPTRIGNQAVTVTVARHGDHMQVRIRIDRAAVPLDRPRTAGSGEPATPARREPTPRPVDRSEISSLRPHLNVAREPTPRPVDRSEISGVRPVADAVPTPVARTRTPPPADPVSAQRGKPGPPIERRSVRRGTLSSLRAVREVASRIELSRPMTLDRRITEVLRKAKQQGASDVHISAARPPMLRLVGQLVPDGAPMQDEDLELAIRPLLNDARREALQKVGHVDMALEVEGVGRLRTNVSRQRLGMKICFRLVDDAPRPLGELGLPPELEKVTRYHQGLIVVSGPSGQGKTTTLAALVDLFNAAKPDHIITVEDPIEVMHPRKRAVISQREVGTHTRSFQAALKGALREDPDVIVIGELRDRETVEMALSAAETGHIVLATMSTPNGAKTIDRLIDLFPPDDQAQVRSTLAGALKMVISQRLVPAIDGTRRLVAAELITGNVPLWSLIRDDKLFQLPSLLQRGRGYGMIRVEESLQELLDAGKIDRETARRYADDPRVFEEATAATSAAGDAPSERSGVRELVGNLFGRKS